MAKTEKWMQYAVLITEKVKELIDEDGEIGSEELSNDDNLTEFFHALANVAPAHIFNGIKGAKKNHIEFNHLENPLCFKYSNKAEE